MVYTIKELQQKITPITRKYDIPAVYIFGSYARGQATEESDVDMLIDRTGSKIVTMFDMGALYSELNEKLGKSLDIVTEDALTQDEVKRRTPHFAEEITRERVAIYE